jgi:hypothetical protein
MITNVTLQIRAFPVLISDGRSKEARWETVVLTKEQLQAAQLVGQSSKELIYRICNRQGYNVGEIGTPTKREITLNLEELYQFHALHQMGKREREKVTP